MIDLLLSSWPYLILLGVGISIGVFVWPRLIALASNFKNLRHDRSSHAPLATKVDGANVSEQGDLAALTRDSLAQIKQIDAQLSSICQLLEQNNSGVASEYRRTLDEMNTNILKLLSSNESLANNLQAVLQRNLEALNIIVDQAEVKSGPYVASAQTNRLSRSIAAVDGHEIMQPQDENNSATAKLALFDDLIARIKDEVNQASYKGIKNIERFLDHIRQKHPIELHSPSAQVFILFDRNAKLEAAGKAFVLPGSYLGRPWVDWFEMPKGVFERVEATVEPATVARDANGDWNLVKPGSLSQQ